jgi:hypothetical protein
MKFKVRSITQAPELEATHIDMGLCYVSRFIIGPLSFYSILRQDAVISLADIVAMRLQEDQKQMQLRGFYHDEGAF